ncbi:MAG: hypothetical protein AB7T63_06400 [Planctomycetota bacterium]
MSSPRPLPLRGPGAALPRAPLPRAPISGARRRDAALDEDDGVPIGLVELLATGAMLLVLLAAVLA